MRSVDYGRRSDGRAVGAAHARVAVRALMISVLTAVATPAAAQTAADPLFGRNVPYGSPLDPAGTGTNASATGLPNPFAPLLGTTANGSGQGGSAIQPVEIGNRSDGDRTAESDEEGTSSRSEQRRSTVVSAAQDITRRPAAPSEFELYVEQRLGRKLLRFGADLLVPGSRDFAVPATTSVPPSYVLNVGDEVSVGLTGSVDGSFQATIDTDGRVFIPKVGSVSLAGVRYGDLRQTLAKVIGRQYRDFRVAVTISKLRGIRVYVTGFANNPGAYTVNSLSSLVNATLAAGGPAAGGSFRSIRLLRDGKVVTDFDLYDLIRNGDKSRDAILQNQDVLYIPPVGPQIALVGSVNAEAIYETRQGETLSDVLRLAGGANALADDSRIILNRVSDLDIIGSREIAATALTTTLAQKGDIVQILSVGTLARPLDRQAVLVRIEGEVNKPGNYYVQPNAGLDEVLALAGGLTSRAFVYGTRFERFSVMQQQKASFDEAVNQLEISLAAAPLSGDQLADSGTRAAQIAAAQGVLARLRRAVPDGRVVLNLPPSARSLPQAFSLENNDRIAVPPLPTTVGVFGAVYRPASFLIDREAERHKVSDYLKMAGGPLRVADRSELFVIHANGAVASRRNGGLNAAVIPGDVIFVPVKTQASSIFAKIRDISTILFQLGLTTAAFVAIAH